MQVFAEFLPGSKLCAAQCLTLRRAVARCAGGLVPLWGKGQK